MFGMVKLPVYVEPAASTIVSPHVAALIADCSALAFPAPTFRTVPVCTGIVTSTEAFGSVGSRVAAFTGAKIVKRVVSDTLAFAMLVAFTVTVPEVGTTAGAV